MYHTLPFPVPFHHSHSIIFLTFILAYLYIPLACESFFSSFIDVSVRCSLRVLRRVIYLFYYASFTYASGIFFLFLTRKYMKSMSWRQGTSYNLQVITIVNQESGVGRIRLIVITIRPSSLFVSTSGHITKTCKKLPLRFCKYGDGSPTTC